MALTIAAELLPHRINVNVIEPGWIDTPGEHATFGSEAIAPAGPTLPWGRLGTPEDIGRAAVFLCSDDADYITGTELVVDGGLCLRGAGGASASEKAEGLNHSSVANQCRGLNLRAGNRAPAHGIQGLLLQLDRHLADLAGELVVAFLVVVGHRRLAVHGRRPRLRRPRRRWRCVLSIRPSATFSPLTKIVPVPPLPRPPPSYLNS